MGRRLKNRIKDLRDQRGWSLEKVAEMCADGTTAGTIHKLETGSMKLTVDWIDTLADAFGVDSVELVDDRPAGKYPDDVGDDVVPYKPDERAKSGPNLHSDLDHLPFEVITDRLDELGVLKGVVVEINTSAKARNAIATGDILVAKVFSDSGATRTIIREFIEPSLLVSNSRFENVFPINMRTARVEILGIVETSHRAHSRQR